MITKTITNNPWQRAARLAKAERLAAQLYTAGVRSSEIPMITPEHWLALAKALGIRPPSETTIGMIAELMAEMEAAKRRVDALISGADLFARFAA